MEYYLPLKLLHIVSSTILFGTGLGTAFYMWRADRSGNPAVVAVTARNVVLADWMFTTPAVVVQPLTGVVMVYLAEIPLSTPWVLYSILLYLFIGFCWLPVVYIQIRVAKLSALAAAKGAVLDYSHRIYMRWWYLLGCSAFISVICIFYLMVFKPTN